MLKQERRESPLEATTLFVAAREPTIRWHLPSALPAHLKAGRARANSPTVTYSVLPGSAWRVV